MECPGYSIRRRCSCITTNHHVALQALAALLLRALDNSVFSYSFAVVVVTGCARRTGSEGQVVAPEFRSVVKCGQVVFADRRGTGVVGRTRSAVS